MLWRGAVLCRLPCNWWGWGWSLFKTIRPWWCCESLLGPIVWMGCRARKRGGANPYLEKWKVPLFYGVFAVWLYSKNIAYQIKKSFFWRRGLISDFLQLMTVCWNSIFKRHRIAYYWLKSWHIFGQLNIKKFPWFFFLHGFPELQVYNLLNSLKHIGLFYYYLLI